MEDRPYGLQQASAIVYTLAVTFLTFAHTRDFKPYYFTCPAVRTQIARLIYRHVCFLVALFAVQTAAFRLRPHLHA